MIVSGRSTPNSWTSSAWPRAAKPSTSSSATSRMRGSSALIFGGVNAGLIKPALAGVVGRIGRQQHAGVAAQAGQLPGQFGLVGQQALDGLAAAGGRGPAPSA